jgi:hypothetical protein
MIQDWLQFYFAMASEATAQQMTEQQARLKAAQWFEDRCLVPIHQHVVEPQTNP